MTEKRKDFNNGLNLSNDSPFFGVYANELATIRKRKTKLFYSFCFSCIYKHKHSVWYEVQKGGCTATIMNVFWNYGFCLIRNRHPVCMDVCGLHQCFLWYSNVTENLYLVSTKCAQMNNLVSNMKHWHFSLVSFSFSFALSLLLSLCPFLPWPAFAQSFFAHFLWVSCRPYMDDWFHRICV